MEIINENYILLTFEFDENKKFSVNDFRSVIMGIDEEINNLREKKKKLQIHNVPSEVNKDFVKRVKNRHKEELDAKTTFLYPLDYSIIKRVVQTFKVGDRIRYTNKPAGIIVLFKYMGPLMYISDFLNILKQKIDFWKNKEKDIFSNTRNQKIIIGSESKYMKEIINQNYFLLNFIFCSERADPNDFRRALLGLGRAQNIPEMINYEFRKIIKQKYGENLDSDVKYIYPIDFAIIKRPVIYNTEKGEKKSDFAAGVILLYKYMGPLVYINDFNEILQLAFKKLREGKKKLFNKANDPLIIIGAELKYFEGFN